MTRTDFKQMHRAARIGNLGTLACTLPNRMFQWFLHEVYDLRFPHVGSDRHALNRWRFDSMLYGGDTHKRLVAAHHARGWWNCQFKPLIRLWVEWKAQQKAA